MSIFYLRPGLDKLQDLDEADIVEEAAAAGDADAEAIERRRLQEAEEWRLQQLRSGASDVNPNLQVRSYCSLCRVPLLGRPLHEVRR